MNHSRRNVHNSGPLGMLLNRGLVARVDEKKENENVGEAVSTNNTPDGKNSTYYLDKNTGIRFKESDLLAIDPAECESWEYANRMQNEIGDIDELIESIRQNSQLQPALIRSHPNPHGKIKYQIIFGRRRHIACGKLGVPLLAIKKDSLSVQDAIATQDAENRSRKNVSNYSNALLYKKLLEDGVFKEEKAIAERLGISKSTFSELMAYTKIPEEIVQRIPNIHIISNNLILEILSLLKKGKEKYQTLLQLAPQIGVSITSADKLQQAVNGRNLFHNLKDNSSISYKSTNGKTLFTYKKSSGGKHSLTIYKEIATKINQEDLCNVLRDYLERYSS